MSQLTAENFKKGFLIDDELMAGITESDGSYLAFVLNHSSGEYLGQQIYADLGSALKAIDQIQRDWIWESTSACGTGNCGDGAQCGTGLCPKVGTCSLPT